MSWKTSSIFSFKMCIKTWSSLPCSIVCRLDQMTSGLMILWDYWQSYISISDEDLIEVLLVKGIRTKSYKLQSSKQAIEACNSIIIELQRFLQTKYWTTPQTLLQKNIARCTKLNCWVSSELQRRLDPALRADHILLESLWKAVSETGRRQMLCSVDSYTI